MIPEINLKHFIYFGFNELVKKVPSGGGGQAIYTILQNIRWGGSLQLYQKNQQFVFFWGGRGTATPLSHYIL